MPDFAEPITRLIDQFKRLPGIGQKTAQRLAFHVLRTSPEEALALAEAIRDAKVKIRECSLCNNITDTDPCFYCTSPNRNHSVICVVEEPHNIIAIERTRQYNGLYHVLGGALSPLEGVGPDQLKLKSLIERLKGRNGFRDHHRHQSHRRRRSHRRLHFEADQAPRRPCDPHWRGHPGWLGPGVCR